MFDVNDDMDELFRRAADGYPLKTDTSDWKKVEQKLAGTQSDKPVKFSVKNKRWLLLLLLFPAGWIYYNYSYNADNKSTTANASLEETQQLQRNSNNTNKGDNSLARTFTEKDVNKESRFRKYEAKNNDVQKAIDSKRGSTVNGSDKKRPDFISSASRASTPLTLEPRGIENKSSSGEKIGSDSNEDLHTGTANNRSIVSGKDLSANTKASGNIASTKVPDKSSPANTEALGNTASTKIPDKDLSANTEVSGNTPSEVSDKVLPPNTEAPGNTAQSKIDNPQTKKKLKERKKTLHFYAGVVANADLSTVKFQLAKTPGLGAGILAGYQLTKKLSIESGLSFQKKFYYTKAGYFNPKTPYLSPSYKPLSVDGNCEMFELPLNLKYNLKSSANDALFAIAGFSSFFMKSENYEYTYEAYGQVRERYMTYKNSSSSWLTVINANVGYERRVGKTKSGTLRIEPYLKIPINGYGFGRLPITSTGINLGYTRKLF